MRSAAALPVRWLVCWLGLTWLALVALPAAGQSLESALRPGDVIQGHAKWEDECAQCHVRFNRAAQTERCMACHKDIGADVRQRTGYHGKMKPDACRACHTDHKGRDARIVELDVRQFDHTLTDYALKGKHRDVKCESCHTPARKKYSQAPQDCLSCHRKDDTHKGSLGGKCADCHSEVDWKQTNFDHDKTRFALTGKHIDTKCADCHRVGVPYRETPRTCIGCHRKDDDSAKGHRGRFGEKCESCHATKAWKPPTFNHDTDTRWALRGKHRGATCGDCHTGHLFKDKIGSACVDCHRKDDKHKGNLGRECQACHTERDWKETSRFDHDKTAYPLLGKHREARCESCHEGQRYKNTPTTCISCHRKDDKHQPSLGERCESCHIERGWKDVARFDHSRTRFVLRERHAEVRCDACHKSSNFREAPRTCNGCHEKDDKHKTTLGTACGDCHSERRWVPAAGFDHQRTKFPLRNAHAARTVECKACHADVTKFRPTATECISCHRKDDKHEAQLGTACESCHDDTRWKNTRFDHASARFALTGRHLPLACAECHKTQRYRDAPRDCDSCHRKDDKHKLTLGTACESCHNARGWALWRFDHQRTRFALEGAHQRTACVSCHAKPAPAGKAIAPIGDSCIACHARDDKHDGAFGAQCDRCHNATDWRQVSRRMGSTPVPQRLMARLGEASWFTRTRSTTTAGRSS
jgi:hypothetical protein